MEIYQVKSGDSLSIIARDVLGDMSRWPDLARLNNLVQPYTIFPGMQLILPDLEVLGPVVVPAERRTPTTQPPPARAAFALTPQMWMYVAIGVVVLLLMVDRK